MQYCPDYKSKMNRLIQLCVLLPVLLLAACSHDDGSAAWRTYPDAVVNINQVDPAYRAHFRSQHGSNYSLRDQREAFIAATRTARTPVPKYVPQQATSRPKKQARRGKSAARGRGRASSSKRQARGKAKSGSRTKVRTKTTRKSTKRRR